MKKIKLRLPEIEPKQKKFTVTFPEGIKKPKLYFDKNRNFWCVEFLDNKKALDYIVL